MARGDLDIRTAFCKVNISNRRALLFGSRRMHAFIFKRGNFVRYLQNARPSAYNPAKNTPVGYIAKMTLFFFRSGPSPADLQSHFQGP